MRKKIILILIIFLVFSCKRKLDTTNAIKVWKIENYQIAYFQKIGPVGPPFYEHEVYRNEYYLETGYSFDNDTCKIKISPSKDHVIVFNLCNLKKIDLHPDKKEFKTSNIDSIKIYSKKLDQIKILNNKQIDFFIKSWNNSTVSGLRNYKTFDSIFYPKFRYKVWVYEGEKMTEFVTSNHLIADTSKWVWEIANYEEDYFDEIWDQAK